MPKGKKNCPQCQRTNGARAHQCKHCGYMFAAGRKIKQTSSEENVEFSTFGSLASSRIPDDARRQPTQDVFESMAQLVQLVGRGFANGLFVCGPGGTGKTYTVTKTLELMGLKYGQDWFKISGHASPLGLYNSLYERQDKLVVFDDCDAVLKNMTGLNVLKAALDTKPRRELAWNSTSAQAIVDRFEFTGRVIFISNINPRESTDVNLQAMLSRVLCIVIGKTREEILKRTIEYIPIIMPDLDEEIYDEVEDWLTSNMDTVDVSFRMLVKLNGLIKFAPDNWRELAISLQ